MQAILFNNIQNNLNKTYKSDFQGSKITLKYKNAKTDQNLAINRQT